MASSARRPSRARVAVFAKAPVAGHVKTRLVPALGAAGAARLHAALVRHALATAAAAGLDGVELWAAPPGDDGFLRACAAEFDARLHVQQGGDLGERMAFAMAAAHAAGHRLVLIGSDCPALAAADLRAAAAALDDCDVAIAPAEDGGYVLVAMAAPHAQAFHGIDWGSACVMRQTRERLGAAGIAWRELPGSWDVDRPDDLARLRAERLLPEALA